MTEYFNPKRCPRCASVGYCVDSRQMDEYVRRNYACESKACGWRWTTAEVVVDQGMVLKRGNTKSKEFAASLKGLSRMSQALEKARTILREAML